MWTKKNLQEVVRTRLDGRRLILVSNREPYQHFYNRGRIESSPPASGMVSALEPIMKTCGGTWIAHASGNADRRVVDAMDHVQVPPDKPSYALRRVWLTKEQEDGYYNGLSNEGLWPLCHMVFTRPIFNLRHWEAYRQVNEIFARAVLQEAGDDSAFVFIQDYHFALLPQMLKEQNANLIVAQFWHIPWPTPEVLQTFPWKEELMEGLLGNDLLGFHLRYHCQNFLDSVDRTLEAKIDSERFEIIRGGKSTLVRPFPISIDFEEHVELAGGQAVKLEMERWRDSLSLSNDQALGIGIDRIDYTKGIPERLRGVDCFLEKYPSHRGKLVFVQIGVPSRTHIPQYQALDDEIDGLVESINWKWSTDAWRPIIYLKHQHSAVQMMALHRLARFAIVSSLDDGMNLVAKEFVASRVDEDGVLILSRFTGAARELTHALLVNPFAVEEQAEALYQALGMPEEERRRRMSRLRGVVAENNVYRWAGKLLSTLLKLEVPENAYAENGLFATVS